tara:strand:+ start:25708 stop:27984 length:2277 start_codon:yes stop_codon:yes gene_type:complete
MIVSLRLNVNGIAVIIRVYETTSLQISKFLTSVDNLSKSGTITEERFRVNLTSELITLIGDLTDPSQTINIDINQSISGEILVYGFPRFKGSFFITESFLDPISNLKEIDLLFQGGETDVKAELTSVSMASLFEGDTIPYNFAELKSYFDNPDTYVTTNGWLFPYISYTPEIRDKFNMQFYDFKPAVLFSECFSKMPFIITVDSSLDDLMNQAILLHNNKSSIPITNTSPLDNTGSMASNINQTVLSSGAPYTTLFNIDFQTKNVYLIDDFDLTANTYTVPFEGTYTYKIKGQIELINNSATALTQSYWGGINVGGSLLPFSFFGNQVTIPANSSIIVNVDETKQIFLSTGNVCSIGVFQFGNSGDQTRIISGFQFSILQSPSVSVGTNVVISRNCPDLSAWDIVRIILIQCNGVLETVGDGTYNINPWTKWINEGTTNYFIDNILDYDKNISLQPFSLEGAKTIKLGYEDGNDFYSLKYKEEIGSNYGDLIIEDTGSSLTKNIIELKAPISPLPVANITTNRGLVGANINTQVMYDSDGKIVSGKPTIIHYKPNQTMLLSFNLQNETTPSLSVDYTTVPFLGSWESFDGGFAENDYNFGQSLTFWTSLGYPNNTLYERFWRRYIENTYTRNSRILKCSIRLTQNEFDSLKFNEKFYYKGSIFRLIEISGYELTEKNTVDATFMKVFNILNIDKAPFYPSNVIGAVVQWKDSLTNAALTPPDGSAANQLDLEASANAYGFFYDANQDIATQIGQILQS